MVASSFFAVHPLVSRVVGRGLKITRRNSRASARMASGRDDEGSCRRVSPRRRGLAKVRRGRDGRCGTLLASPPGEESVDVGVSAERQELIIQGVGLIAWKKR